jgi:protein SCO1/2
MKNKSYIGLSFVILVFGIWVVKEIRARYFNDKELIEIGSAPSFSFTNQNRVKITDQTMKGKVYLVEFFFATCPTICPKMNVNMLKIEKKFIDKNDFGIISITINPEEDTPKLLKEHSEHLGVKHPNWHFLSGDSERTMELANKGFNLYSAKNPKIDGGFEHSGLVAIIDKKGNIRCRKDKFNNPIVYYDLLDENKEIGLDAIKEDVKQLLNEK